MKNLLLIAILFHFLTTLTCKADSQAIAPFPEDSWGVYAWANFNPEIDTPDNSPLIKGAPIIIKWDTVEPLPGKYQFDMLLREKLELIAERGYYTFLMMWFVPSTPDWVFEKGVPALEMTPTINPFRKVRDWIYPYYLDEDYKRYYHRVIRAFGAYIRSLPERLQSRILFVQSAEGTTGDGFWYKGEPLDRSYIFTHDQWGTFRQNAWSVFKEGLTGDDGKMVVPLLVNYDSNREEEYDWLAENLDIVGLKNGMFSHGYHISHTTDRLAHWNSFRKRLNSQGTLFFSRGEQDGEWDVCGWSKQNPEEAFYWSSIFASHCGLSMWNIPGVAHVGRRFESAMNFFNRHAGQLEPETSTHAFCALRKGLDASNTIDYPEAEFGKAHQHNIDRYLKIAEKHIKHGAMQGDPEKAIGNPDIKEEEGAPGVTTYDGMMNRQRDDYNDVGWKIWPGNYERHLRQIDPDATSTAMWHVGPVDGIYGRFARAIPAHSESKSMYFDLDDGFIVPDNKISVRIVWLDEGTANWSLLYDSNGAREKIAFSMQNQDSGKWKEKTLLLTDIRLENGCEKGADFIIRSDGTSRAIFHLLDLSSM